MAETGTLYVVATPIGNLQDVTSRAKEILSSVDVIACEDTRVSAKLLQAFHVSARLIVYHDHNEQPACEKLLKLLQTGSDIALISDAGTPLISDPGYRLVQEAHKTGVNVIPIPGACAAISALSVAGLPTDKFIFEGFLPPKLSAKYDRLKDLLPETRTMIFYESPHRIENTLTAIAEIFGQERKVFFAREMTKQFETYLMQPVAEILEKVQEDRNQRKGEIVLVVAGVEKQSKQEIPETTQEILKLLLDAVPLKQAVNLTVKITGERKKPLYQLALDWTK